MGFFRRAAAPLPELEQEIAANSAAHPLHSLNYEPRFPRISTTRRVLGHITEELDRTDLGPRNTLPALTFALIADDHTDIHYPEQVPPFLDDLVEAGLASELDGVYTVTEAGQRELMN